MCVCTRTCMCVYVCLCVCVCVSVCVCVCVRSFHATQISFCKALIHIYMHRPGEGLGGGGESERESEKERESPVKHDWSHTARRINNSLCLPVLYYPAFISSEVLLA